MARVFTAANNDNATIALVLGSPTQITVSFWFWIDAYSNNDAALFYATNEPNVSANRGFYAMPSRATAPAGGTDIGMAQGGTFREDQFTRPSASAWHHVMATHNRTTQTNAGWVDGVSQSLTSIATGSMDGAFADNTLTFGKYGSTYLSMRLAEWALWADVSLTTADAVALAAGKDPRYVHGTGLLYYFPMRTAAAPEYGQVGASPTYNGTTISGGPPGLWEETAAPPALVSYP